MEVLAIDWSGAASARDQREHIWTASVVDGQLTSLRNGLTRQEVIGSLRRMAESNREFVVGLDFAFSMPAWFFQERGLHSAYALWKHVALEGERWLRECEPPFWGRPGTKKMALQAFHRQTELRCEPVTGISPKSVFQLYGPGSVGTGSLRGMPLLAELHDAHFYVWPFDPPGWPRVVEIYPRVLTGSIVKSDREARRAYLDDEPLPPDLREIAEGSEDAFDAAVSALVMSRHLDELGHLEQTSDPLTELEGTIWVPRAVADRGSPRTGRPHGARDIGTPFQKSLGLRWSILDKEAGVVAVEMDIRDDLRGPAGSLEGGVVSTLADVAGASAVGFKVGLVATEHIAVSFLAPGRVGPVRAVATLLRIGKHDGVCEVRVVDTGKDDRLMAVATVTVRVLGKQPS